MKEVHIQGNIQVREPVGQSSPMRVCHTKMVEFMQAITEYDAREITIPAGTVDLTIDFAGVSNVVFIFAQSDKYLKWKVNGTTDETGAGQLFTFTGSSMGYLTSLSVSNPGTDDARVLIIIGG